MGQNSRFEFRAAGFGGQGIVTIGKILGTAFSVYSKMNSVNTQSYGPESRGGACRSEIIVSNGEINYPYVREAEVFVALSQIAYDIYIKDLKEGGILMIDPEAVEIGNEGDRFQIYQIPVVKIAHAVGNVKCLNAVALGGLSALLSELISKSALVKALEVSVPSKTVLTNLSAFEMGRKHIKENYSKVN